MPDVRFASHPSARRKAAAEPHAEAPAPSPEAKPDMAAPVLEPSSAKP